MAFKRGIARNTTDVEGHGFLLTFHCHDRYSLLSRDRCKRIVLSHLNMWGARWGVGIVGFVLMNNHVHLLVRPLKPKLLAPFLRDWKAHSALDIVEFFRADSALKKLEFLSKLKDSRGNHRVWMRSTHCINIYSAAKAIQKLEYMHGNPVRAGLVDDVCGWPWSSAAYFLKSTPCPVRLVAVDGPLPAWLEESHKNYLHALERVQKDRTRK
jgi:putative transposase